jgi:hypothetical protein
MVMTVVALVSSNQSHAESAQDILEAAWDAQVSRWEGLDSYLVEQSEMGRTAKRYFVRTTVVDSAGTSRTIFQPAADAGLEPGCVNPSSMADVPAGKGDMSAEHLTWFMKNAKLVGEESVDGKPAWQLRAEDLDLSQTMSTDEVTIDSMTMWFGKDRYLPLKMRMEGTANMEGQSRPIIVDMLASDFREVPDSKLVEPFRRVVSISGITAGIDEAQIAEARKAMAEMEKQLASMPESQREMMVSMMGPQLEQLRNLAQSGSFETDIVIESITPNPEAFGERIVACDQ